MPYVERVTRAGKTIEVERYYTARYRKTGSKRAKKIKPTSEQQEKINNKQAERKLRLIINTNFGYGDYHIVLDYIRNKEHPDRTPEEMKADIRKFLSECRKRYRKAGKEFKYIHVMEIGEKGARHHHLVVNGIDPRQLQEAWYKAYEGHNRVKIFPLDDTGQYADLAAYLIKFTGKHLKDPEGERLMGKRWSSSRNLKKPIEEKRIISRRYFRTNEPKAKKGYYIDKRRTEQGITGSACGGYGFFRYTMVMLN